MTIFCVSADRGIAWDGTKGASVHLRSLVGALNARGEEVVCFAKKTLGRRIHERLRLVPLDGRETILHWADALGAPEFIYERYSLGSLVGLDAARTLGVPFILEVNAALVDEAEQHRPGTVAAADRAIEERLWREADVIAVVSSALRARVADVRRKSEGVVVIWNGCDEHLFHGEKSPVDPAARPRIAFLGHPKPWHGAMVLPDLLTGLDRLGLASEIEIIGGGPGAEDVRRRAESLGVANRLTITGELPHEAAIQRLRGAAMSVAPYPRLDDFYFCPIKIIESMAAGVPVLSTAQGDIPDILGGHGVLVSPGDFHALVKGAAEILANPARAATMAEAGRKRALDQLTWAASAERLLTSLRPDFRCGRVTS